MGGRSRPARCCIGFDKHRKRDADGSAQARTSKRMPQASHHRETISSVDMAAIGNLHRGYSGCRDWGSRASPGGFHTAAKEHDNCTVTGLATPAVRGTHHGHAFIDPRDNEEENLPQPEDRW